MSPNAQQMFPAKILVKVISTTSRIQRIFFTKFLLNKMFNMSITLTIYHLNTQLKTRTTLSDANRTKEEYLIQILIFVLLIPGSYFYYVSLWICYKASSLSPGFKSGGKIEAAPFSRELIYSLSTSSKAPHREPSLYVHLLKPFPYHFLVFFSSIEKKQSTVLNKVDVILRFFCLETQNRIILPASFTQS